MAETRKPSIKTLGTAQLPEGPYRFDQKHDLVVHFVYELPFRQEHGRRAGCISRMEMNGIVSIRSGFPYTVGVGSSATTTTAAI